MLPPEFGSPVDGPLIVNDAELALLAALDGVGIAYLFDHQVQPWIAAGKLVRVLAAWSPPFPGFYLYYPSRRHLPPALRAFIDFARRTSETPSDTNAAQARGGQRSRARSTAARRSRSRAAGPE
ncbi:MAG TPA: LysR substrate-binding domain-containing protein [Kofleriaceae bacterium]|nr:LysR substrate-binding domain-containing protein [Kofleriaceae bacterium]